MKNLIYVLFIAISTIISTQSCINEANASKVSKTAVSPIESTNLRWHSIKDIESLTDSKKGVIVDVYTDWCKWCKVMDKETFADPDMIAYLNENFHLVKFNAEEKSTLNFKGQSFNYTKGGKRGYNALAAKLCQDKLSYPSFVVLDSDLNTLDVLRGFKKAEQFKGDLERALFASKNKEI